MHSDRPPFAYDTDNFPYDPAEYTSGAGLLKTVVLGLALMGAVLLVVACYGPDPAPVAGAATSL